VSLKEKVPVLEVVLDKVKVGGFVVKDNGRDALGYPLGPSTFPSTVIFTVATERVICIG